MSQLKKSHVYKKLLIENVLRPMLQLLLLKKKGKNKKRLRQKDKDWKKKKEKLPQLR
jgi:hypothetical protein